MFRATIVALAISCGLAVHASARLTDEERKQASELYKKFTAAKDDLPARTKIVDEMADMGADVAKVIYPIIKREYREADQRYRSGFIKTAKAVAAKKGTGEKIERINQLRSSVQALRRKGGLSKDDIKRIGDPAVAELRKLTRLERGEIMAGSENLAKARRNLIELGKQRNACIDSLLLIDEEPFDEKAFEAEEREIAAAALNMDRDAQAILAQNKKLAEQIEPAEAEGIADLNELRILIGLRPCLIDPKLCDASRGHSKDMREKNFFSHDSPVPGKGSPWTRAKLAGTSANSENIYVGSTSGKSANKGWWYSPGHHKNMLAPGARRVGMGVSGKHWTQMFGG